MNKDFHYYGTYAAARLAGYDAKDALVIAYSAQFVDECDKKMLKDKDGIQTVQDSSELMKYASSFQTFTTEELETIKNIWSIFHFLPANYSAKDLGIKDAYPSKNLHLICIANSKTVHEMIKNTSKDASLELIGLRMHVLADTWAHQYFAGIPDKNINDLKDLNFDLNLHTPPNPFRDNSVVYLGHGRIGHLPDLAYIKYSYRPVWSDTTIEKDNPKEFLKAFKQMLFVLKSLKEGGCNYENYKDLDDNKVNILKGIFQSNADDQSEFWQAKMFELIEAQDNIPLFSREKFCPNFDYQKFQDAAEDQLNFVTGYLSYHKIL